MNVLGTSVGFSLPANTSLSVTTVLIERPTPRRLDSTGFHCAIRSQSIREPHRAIAEFPSSESRWYFFGRISTTESKIQI